QRIATETAKKIKIEAAAKEKNAKVYKNKQQRSAEANRRNQIRQTENEIEELQQQLDALNEEISHEEVFSNYELMNEKCTEIENIKQKIDDLFDLLVELDA
ncbi:MAG: ABC transporter, partial [Ruminococcus sp.]|nr:ABC transporter [Ruminococcus sp.]